MQNQDNKLELAANYIKDSKYLVAFTGAGISVESGIPPFRGAEGLWSKYDPQVLDLGYFHQNPLESWEVIKEIFYDFFGNAKPNPAHIALAQLEKMGILKCVITQNIDNLHQAAGNTIVHEFHGNSQKLVCTSCSRHYKVKDLNLDVLPPLCESCNSLIKPDFILVIRHHFENGISVFELDEGHHHDHLLCVKCGSIIEVNPESSRYTDYVTDIHLQGKAGKVMVELLEKIAELE
ncbi:MAG: RNA polymerase subunit sigma [Bacteroidetes bacterium 4572_114]|nr:MAG: RNA polymerase subunit sigma [Bacteroidetes bacterium 4572_114]